MGESDSTTSSPRRYEYTVNTIYSVHAEDGKAADKLFNDAYHGAEFSDGIIIAQEVIRRIEEIPDGGERHWVWNTTLNKWEITRYNLH